MTAIVYIDGFNMYYGSVKETQYKWLNLLAMCQILLPGRTIKKIRYFTAEIKAQKHDIDAPVRQKEYLKALATIPNFFIHYGSFVERPQKRPIYPLEYPDPSSPPKLVRILRTEEKRSDVNLATFLMLDCIDENFDEAVVISNDSDLLTPIESAINRFNKRVGVINPQHSGRASRELSLAASWSFRKINRSVLAASQFPDTVATPRGPVTKPLSW